MGYAGCGMGMSVLLVEADATAGADLRQARADSYFRKPVVVAELVARMRLHGVGDAPTAALEDDIARASRDGATIADLRKRIFDQDALLERTTRDLAKARADLVRATGTLPLADRRALEQRLRVSQEAAAR